MSEVSDRRRISRGLEIPTEAYADQPYVVKTDDGAWLCVITTGAGREGARGQHVVTTRSTDGGRSWSSPVDVEPADGPEASYAVLLKVPSGRIYCFYNHNTDDVRAVKTPDPSYPNGLFARRADCLGYFVLKYSDDHGRSWSSERFVIPVREFAIDRENSHAGEIRFFWNVGRPFVHEGAGYVPLIKIGNFGYGDYIRTEGVLLRSPNILSEPEPERITWETLPDGDVGLRTPEGGGAIAEEQSFVVLSDGSFHCVYRTIDGHPACTYSRDNGHTWTPPEYRRYADGRLMKHPRAANFHWRCQTGQYLYWFHNHGGRWFDDRNPVWLSGGVEADSPNGKVVLWSQPEIALYDDDPFVRMSYPDLIEQDGKYYLTETQKDIARVHEIDPTLVEGLWSQFTRSGIPSQGLVLSLPELNAAMPREVRAPKLPTFCERDQSRPDFGTKDLRQGLALDLWVRLASLAGQQVVLDNRTVGGQGFCLQTSPRGTMEIVLNDGRTENRWDSDLGLLEVGRLHHVVVIVDGGPKLVTFVVDGRLCDGGESRQFGWGRFSPQLRGVNGAALLRIGPSLDDEIVHLRVYDRYLRTSEAVSIHRAGCAVAARRAQT